MSVSGSCLLFLFCLFFFFQVVLLFLVFYCFLFVVLLFLNHNLRFVFALHLVFLWLLFSVFVAFIFCYFFDFWKPIKNISEKKNMEIPKTAKNVKCRKKNGHFDKNN